MKTVVYEDGRVTRTVVPRTDWNDPAARFAAEAAARRLPLKRQCTARLRAGAEPRVYPRPSEAALHCPFTGRCRAAGLPAHLSATLLVDENGRTMRTVVRRTDSDSRNRWYSRGRPVASVRG